MNSLVFSSFFWKLHNQHIIVYGRTLTEGGKAARSVRLVVPAPEGIVAIEEIFSAYQYYPCAWYSVVGFRSVPNQEIENTIIQGRVIPVRKSDINIYIADLDQLKPVLDFNILPSIRVVYIDDSDPDDTTIALQFPTPIMNSGDKGMINNVYRLGENTTSLYNHQALDKWTLLKIIRENWGGFDVEIYNQITGPSTDAPLRIKDEGTTQNRPDIPYYHNFLQRAIEAQSYNSNVI